MVRLKPLQRIERRVARAVMRLPLPAIRRLVGEPIARDGYELNPQVQLAIKLDRRANRKQYDDVTVAQARRLLEINAGVFAVSPPALASVEDLRLSGPAGAIPARIYRPRGLGSSAPALVFLHGGGFVLGSLDSHDPPLRLIAAECRAVVIAIDYRLAPEHPFPAGVDDALAAFRAIARDAARLGIDPARIAIGGDSAGGNLAAVVSLMTRGEALRPCFQLLIYPTVDMTMSFPSIASMAEGFFLERASMDWFLARYLPKGQDKRDPRASPLWADDLAGLPPAFVLTAGFDPLRDEGDAYAKALLAAGNQVEHRCYGSLFHGFFNASGFIHAAREPMRDLVASLRRAGHLNRDLMIHATR